MFTFTLTFLCAGDIKQAGRPCTSLCFYFWVCLSVRFFRSFVSPEWREIFRRNWSQLLITRSTWHRWDWARGQGPRSAVEILWTRHLLNHWSDLYQNLCKYFLWSVHELVGFVRSWVQRSRIQKNFSKDTVTMFSSVTDGQFAADFCLVCMCL